MLYDTVYAGRTEEMIKNSYTLTNKKQPLIGLITMKIYNSIFSLFLAIAGCHQHPTSMMAVAIAVAAEEDGEGANTNKHNLDAAAQFDDVSLSWFDTTYLVLVSN